MEEQRKELHIAHCKFLEGLPVHETDKDEKMNHSGYYDKIVTSAWSLDRKYNILTYGATIFRKADNRDHWVKADHRAKAIERYNTCPVVVKLINLEKHEINDRAIDWYIARNLVLDVGAYSKVEHRVTEAILNLDDDKQIKITSLKIIDGDFNRKYNPNLRHNLPETYQDENDRYADPFTEDVWWALIGGSLIAMGTYGLFCLV